MAFPVPSKTKREAESLAEILIRFPAGSRRHPNTDGVLSFPASSRRRSGRLPVVVHQN
jgi:hypothetical protein